MPPSFSKKRKRGASSSDNDNDRRALQKLASQVTSSFRQHGKVVKSYESQKAVRKLRDLKKSSSQEQSGNRSRERNLEKKLEKIKNFNLDLFINECIKRLGLDDFSSVQEDSKGNFASDGRDSKKGQKKNHLRFADDNSSDGADLSEPKKDDDDDNDETSNAARETNEFEANLIEKMLSHKRVSKAMKEYMEKIESIQNKTQNKKNKNPSKAGGSSVPDDQIFVASLSGRAPDNNYIGSDDDNNTGFLDPLTKKKNRPGQRTRKAKAMAREARRNGTSYTSLHWRDRNKNGGGDGVAAPLPVVATAAAVAETGKDWKEKEGVCAHPSWLAKQREKKTEGIVAFKGKKITFD